jgi:hypothetical protein
MTSSSASDHGNPAGIAALMQKGTTSKGMEANKDFAKWLSCGIQISGTFGLHHVLCTYFPITPQIPKLCHMPKCLSIKKTGVSQFLLHILPNSPIP